MSSIDSAKKPKKGRPPADTEAVNVRIPRSVLAKIEEWRAAQRPIPTRPEAIRILAARGLRAERYVALLDKSMNLMGQLAREEDNTSALAMQVIEFLGNYNAMSGSYEDDVDHDQLKER